MVWIPFETQVPGKWILAGEHAVLRGKPALALPHPEFKLTLRFTPSKLRNPVLEIYPKSLLSLVHELIESTDCEFPEGILKIESTIPLGAGLGSSAALCVALSQWIGTQLEFDRAQLIRCATQLEDRFHGKSSGLDITVAATGKPIFYLRNPLASTETRILPVNRLPKFTFHDTGLRALTNACIQKVESFRRIHPLWADEVDHQMGKAAQLALDGLMSYDSGKHGEGLAQLTKSIQLARESFRIWNLIPNQVLQLEEELLSQGALAVKLTGAGGGGMIVALWS